MPTGKKSIFIIIVVGIVLAFIIFYFRKPVHVSFSDNVSELNNFDFSRLSNWNCANPLNDSLVNAAHIKRVGSNYEITCEFGKLHSEIYYQDVNNSYVYLGYIKNCDEQTAKLIDDAVRSGPNCIFPVSSAIPDTMNDYYVYYFGCNKFHLSDVPRSSDYCMAQLQDINNPTIYDGGWGVVDVKTSIVY
jgi:hypothetical protein